ncbi:MAG: hypothetical protein IPO15_19245 [Anaerolineae bacterium]|uniref:hypothetical protein n=1 Tax=Candidatus Amarolinea dominans TaxID=3140696 RepID=UPI00313618BA|nr:hypothetical protein [Anaerolineae bacterium]
MTWHRSPASLHPNARPKTPVRHLPFASAFTGLLLLACLLSARPLPVQAAQTAPPAAVAANSSPRFPSPPATRPGIYVASDYSGLIDPQRYGNVGSLRTWGWGEFYDSAGHYKWDAFEAWLNNVASQGKAAGVGITTYNGRCCTNYLEMPAWVRIAYPNSTFDVCDYLTGACTSLAHPPLLAQRLPDPVPHLHQRLRPALPQRPPAGMGRHRPGHLRRTARDRS